MTNDQTGIMASNQAGINDYSVMGDNEDLTQRRREAALREKYGCKKTSI